MNENTYLSNAEKIKLAAMNLFGVYGYGSTTVRMIAKEAGLSPGQIAVHFGSKEELFESIVNDAIKVSNDATNPIWEKREKLIESGEYSREWAWKLINQMLCEFIDYCFDPYHRNCIMMVNVALPNSMIVANAKRSFAETLSEKQERFLAQLLEDYCGKKGCLKYRVISRAVNGAVVSFAEHNELLMSEVYSNREPEQALIYAKGHLKNFILNSLQRIDSMEDITHVEKY